MHKRDACSTWSLKRLLHFDERSVKRRCLGPSISLKVYAHYKRHTLLSAQRQIIFSCGFRMKRTGLQPDTQTSSILREEMFTLHSVAVLREKYSFVVFQFLERDSSTNLRSNNILQIRQRLLPLFSSRQPPPSRL